MNCNYVYKMSMFKKHPSQYNISHEITPKILIQFYYFIFIGFVQLLLDGDGLSLAALRIHRQQLLELRLLLGRHLVRVVLLRGERLRVHLLLVADQRAVHVGAQSSVALAEGGYVLLVVRVVHQPQQVVVDEHLARSMWTRANADHGDIDGFGHCLRHR